MNTVFKIVMLMLWVQGIFAQNVTTPEDAVQAALQNHPTSRAADLDVQARQYAEKGAFNLPNPEVSAESPTGEFYTIGVSQSFALPAVYKRQKQLARAETELAKAGRQLSQNELRYAVRSLYLEAQVAEYQYRQAAERDSLFQLILTAGNRQFAAGDIDFLQKTLIENEAANLRQQKYALEIQAAELRLQLMLQCALQPPLRLLPLSPDTTAFVLPNAVGNNPAVIYEQQSAQVATQQVRLAKSRALPDFALGYINQGGRNTPIDYRFRASIGLPLWVGQYKSGIQSAQAENQAASARAEAQGLNATLELERLRSSAAIARGQLRYFQQEALPRSRTLLSTALRLREAGQVDYTTFLRTIDEAYAIPRAYTVQIQAFESARIQIRYLQGQ